MLWQFHVALVSGMSGLAPLNCLMICATTTILYQTRMIVIWRAVVETPRGKLSNVPVVPWQCKMVTLVTVLLVSWFADLTQRQEFRMKYRLQQLKDAHVKKLEQEKELLVTDKEFRMRLLPRLGLDLELRSWASS